MRAPVLPTVGLVLCMAAFLAGCAAPVVAPEPEIEPTPRQVAALQGVQDQYANGRYGDVVRAVAQSDVLNNAPRATRVAALKVQAFSYCLTNYRLLCQEGFTRILAIDPTFTLSPTEEGHPLWGPAWRDARGSNPSK